MTDGGAHGDWDRARAGPGGGMAEKSSGGYERYLQTDGTPRDDCGRRRAGAMRDGSRTVM